MSQARKAEMRLTFTFDPTEASTRSRSARLSALERSGKGTAIRLFDGARVLVSRKHLIHRQGLRTQPSRKLSFRRSIRSLDEYLPTAPVELEGGPGSA